MVPGRITNGPAEATQATAELDFPVALKALSPDLSHKTEGGLVILNLQNVGQVEEAAGLLLERTAGYRLEGLLVQRMAPPGVEILVGLNRDPQFGLMLACGPGGVLVELLGQDALRLPPQTSYQASEMVKATSTWKLLQGFRGAPAGDLAALVELLVKLSRLALGEAERLVSLDLNPVIVHPAGQGLSIVDGRAVAHNV